MLRHAPRACLVLFCLLVGPGGCARQPGLVPAEPIEAPIRYRVEINAAFETTSPGAPELGPVLEPLARFGERWVLVLNTGLLRRFRDESRGDLLRFEEVQVQPLVPVGSAPDARPLAEALSHPLQGRSVEIRHFDSGEILAINLTGHVVGGDRQMEVLDLLLPVLSPKVPALRQGESLTWNTRWPLSLEEAGKLTGMLRVEWSLEERGRMREQPAWKLSYEGDWRTRVDLREASGLRAERVEAPGRASGTVWLSRRDGEILRHEFQWERTVELPLQTPEELAEDVEPPRLRQVQRFSGSVERLP